MSRLGTGASARPLRLSNGCATTTMAPTQPVTLNGGMEMPSWYDIRGLGDRLQEPCDGIEDSRRSVLQLLEAEAAVVGYERCVLAGFSQGGAMSLYVGLQLQHKLAGILALSCYMPAQELATLSAEALTTPVLQCHGDSDQVVRLDVGLQTKEFLRAAGCSQAHFKLYQDLGHSINDEELDDIEEWMKTTLPPLGGA
eukprot:TRINITY_DN73541_c0_g1_i1.p1 TRINITY_DN73541_c0_g1~~TRINITY_DN73541_c0_g1_i1.p1  ORF type:complete len:197 (-),score=35.78 TRINITY_DN73541_c0_g1_i1:21-611(-)